MRDLFILTIISIFFGTCTNKNLLGTDIELFNGKSWTLAKAVKEQDTTKITKILAKGNIPVDYKEPKFGETLLMWATRTNRIQSVKALLENGANPNLQNDYDGTSALMYASGFGPNYSRDTAILRLLLQHGGNPNIEQNGPRPERYYSRKTPLLMAAGCCYDKVKLLVEAGADIDYKSEYGENALASSIIGGADEKVYIIHYLIINKGANFCEPFFISSSGKKYFVLDELKTLDYPEGSDKHDKKMKLVDYIKKNLNKCPDIP